MNDDPSTDDDDFVARVALAFDRMSVPSAPAARETIEFVERHTSDSGPADDLAAPRRRMFLTGLTRWQRIAAGGATISAVLALGLLLAALGFGSRLSAMERMARQLREVTSYSYNTSSETSTTDPDTNGRNTWRESGKSYWRTPDSFHGAEKIVKIETHNGKVSEEVLEDFVEIFPPGGMGIFVNHKKKTYFRAPFVPTGSRTYPLEPLKIIREDHPQSKCELGTRKIDGKAARGYVVTLKAGFPPREHDWEVWVDPETGLPLEIGYQVDDHKQPRTTTVLRIDHFRWNVPLDAKPFEPKAPEGYREIER